SPITSFPDRAVPTAPEGEKGNRPSPPSSAAEARRRREGPKPLSLLSWRLLRRLPPPPAWGGTSPEALPESGGEAPNPLRTYTGYTFRLDSALGSEGRPEPYRG